MLGSMPVSRHFQACYRLYVGVFFVYLALPLIVVGTFAFNDSTFPALPWNGFTWDWFFGDAAPRVGIFHDKRLLSGIWVSVQVATVTTILSLIFATGNALLFERYQFPGKNLLFMLMLTPLVIPGVILGVSILLSSSQLANRLEEMGGLDTEFLRPGLLLVILGQFAFITTITTLIVTARLRKLDTSLEEAALNLGANPWAVFTTITLPFMAPALLGAGIVSFLMSFENFNTTLMLTGSDQPLTIAMYDRLREGSTPVLNAVSLLLMLGSGLLALVSVFVQRPKADNQRN